MASPPNTDQNPFLASHILSEKDKAVDEHERFAGWRHYPAGVSYAGKALFGADREASLSEKLADWGKEGFVVGDEGFRVNVYEIYDCARIAEFTFAAARDLEAHLVAGGRPRVRVVSISQDNSMAPLNITQDAMRKVLAFFNVVPDFLSALFVCAECPQASDAASGGFRFSSPDGGMSEVSYVLKYAEENGRSQGRPWSIRQSVAYHQIAADGTQTWILLHPLRDSMFQRRIEKMLRHQGGSQKLGNPYNMHTLHLSSYVENWKRYAAHLTADLSKTADFALTFDLGDAADYRLNFERVQDLRYLGDKALLATAYLQGSLGIIRNLKNENDIIKGRLAESDSEENPRHLESYVSLLQADLSSLRILSKRIHSILSLLGEALELKSQAAHMEVNKHLLGLTRETVDDSMTVRVVTLVTLIYLPATFVATMLGMDLFVFDSSTLNIKMAKDFWLFLALSAPLTIFTVGCWVILTIRKRRQRTKLRFRERNEFRV